MHGDYLVKYFVREDIGMGDGVFPLKHISNKTVVENEQNVCNMFVNCNISIEK